VTVTEDAERGVGDALAGWLPARASLLCASANELAAAGLTVSHSGC